MFNIQNISDQIMFSCHINTAEMSIKFYEVEKVFKGFENYHKRQNGNQAVNKKQYIVQSGKVSM